ncbi:hypothetical protein HanIR_Chr10g0480571 [Helianthus annuus]|nr:hypothetical protein HanIR_Chr10g0480571 [Helianthus annuus]
MTSPIVCIYFLYIKKRPIYLSIPFFISLPLSSHLPQPPPATTLQPVAELTHKFRVSSYFFRGILCIKLKTPKKLKNTIRIRG